jgi:hypothetical protein
MGGTSATTSGDFDGFNLDHFVTSSLRNNTFKLL